MCDYKITLKHILYGQLWMYGAFLLIGLIALVLSVKFGNAKKRNISMALVAVVLIGGLIKIVPIMRDIIGNHYIEADVIYDRYSYNSKYEVRVNIVEGDQKYSLILPYLDKDEFPMGTQEAHIVYARHSRILLEVKTANEN